VTAERREAKDIIIDRERVFKLYNDVLQTRTENYLDAHTGCSNEEIAGKERQSGGKMS